MDLAHQYPPSLAGARLSGPGTRAFEALATPDESLVYINGQCHIMATEHAIDLVLPPSSEAPTATAARPQPSTSRRPKRKRPVQTRSNSENNN